MTKGEIIKTYDHLRHTSVVMSPFTGRCKSKYSLLEEETSISDIKAFRDSDMGKKWAKLLNDKER